MSEADGARTFEALFAKFGPAMDDFKRRRAAGERIDPARMRELYLAMIRLEQILTQGREGEMLGATSN